MRLQLDDFKNEHDFSKSLEKIAGGILGDCHVGGNGDGCYTDSLGRTVCIQEVLECK